MRSEKIFIGGWYQRTMLHLSEIYDFLKDASSPLNLNAKKLKDLRKRLDIESMEMKMGDFEYIEIIASGGIKVKIFEDGLIVLNTDYNNAKEDIFKLTTFYEKKLSPAISYLFSLGAPVPKELANIKTVYPYFIVLKDAETEAINILLKEFNQGKYFEIKKNEFEIYRGDKLYIINNVSEKSETIEKIINEQIFVREFKGQLHRYLNLHRIIWEKIADIKERGEIQGKEAGIFKSQIESYKKTINLIEARINQMGSYIGTRGAIVKNDPELQKIIDVLKFKYDTLGDTLSYIKEIWSMTKNYLDSSQQIFNNIQAESTSGSINSLTIITSAGVAASLIKLLDQKMPEIKLDGVIYFLILAFVGYCVNKIMKTVTARKKYKINDIEIAKNIK
ncbi:hypothetical protein A2331_01325 [Candidatus Falkowbacteria bacterium RIFOXYB2_FULL_34_18]|uniref:Uncharacterized protein n=1 Tax=Candidatus Falkowbacteria bacterium RIFOXYD2_FULL_34_120 TaxID=1798007 RepID=A0A1F5TPD6_9BACT|nr:MAG: hypothetical protein A2331_01325 [Candidatus Falkowbacteria bacterium RIFOXYB2_FULL_34_18]OGF29258.1 MAG: hypothetical protein A2500_05205 [Candidatus Falkowbacteria bacterium RIFOXYC12_FULL_34_55]OGF36374.1 MAG: hypothetical protein A2466_00865 [Candidatus Falkowbacteria bacterium RIFOXYC2_FULL_34_220]OGF38853.1 MAG: hypothetical protein A2515_05625 [Candidatus Falkowbacteria bacterium RIFOXYD12_FULL_34_57]OGF40872.1 MAG: hypothetical protein A2531_03850 [Candidatus Falkowbacteria bact